ncbi:unnamed protein product [Cylindrotheca closterium]|uniref:Uncharacterized protein n=1 Tax=Cylindrotheca closterium TaxID=2856 RepID=A0AAD2FSL7_9STRA|nr:unnamed protein product [Cylindrotheca closterium]
MPPKNPPPPPPPPPQDESPATHSQDVSNRRRNRRPRVAVQQNVSPLRSPPPHRTSSPSPPIRDDTNQNNNNNNSNNNARQKKQNQRDKKRAIEWAKQLDAAIPILLDKLFSHLSHLPEEELQERGGVTLPASALGWLTSQYFGPEEASSIWASTRDKLRLLRFLLPRITHLRITRQSWPPPLPDDDSFRQQDADERNPRHTPPPLEFLHTSTSSVCSALTTDTRFPTRKAFLDFMEMLQQRPMMDLGLLFPRLKVLVLDSVPPYWIHKFGSTAANQLQVLRVDKACLYKLPEIFGLPEYPNLTYLRFSTCCVGEMSQLPRLLKRLPNLQFLSLAGNQIRTERTALKGLRNLAHLRKLDLSGNQLANLPNANFCLGNITSLNLAGNNLVDFQGIDKLYGLEVLDLSDNQMADISCLAGLGKLPNLEQLSVQGNPFLLKTPPGYNSLKPSQNARMQMSSSATLVFEKEYRLLILSWFATNRSSVHDLPILHGQPVTERERSAIRAISVHQKYILSKVTTTTAKKIQKVKRKYERKGKAKIQSANSLTMRKSGRLKSESSRTMLQPIDVSFTLYDVLDNMHQENLKAYPEDYQSSEIEDEKQDEKDKLPEKVEQAEQDIQEDGIKQKTKEDITAISGDLLLATEKEAEKETDQVHEETCSANKENEEEEKEKEDARVVQVISPTPSPSKAPKSPDPNSMLESYDSERIESPAPVDTSTERQLREAVSNLSLSMVLEPESTDDQYDDAELEDDPKGVDVADNDDEAADDNEDKGILICDGGGKANGNTDDLGKSPRKSKLADENMVKSPPRIASVNLGSGGAKGQLDIFGADWDVLVQLAAAGLIPNGKLKTPVENVNKAQPDEDIFAQADELLPGPIAPRVSKLELLAPSVTGASSVITDDLSEIASVVRSITVDSAYQDDYSLSSFDAIEAQVPSKFQLAEKACVYDGPETCRNFNVLQNMDLYFTSFVFRDTTTVTTETKSTNEDGEIANQVYPRIQLWPDDRKSLKADDTSGLGDVPQNNRERCARVWEEDVIPCGKSSLRRLGPNRNVRLTFHGDKVVKNSAFSSYAESRKVYLCLSSDALYVIARKDEVTLKKKRKKFPLPIRDNAKFGNAPWPHAIARHSYHDLQAIVIGFDFQRLTLRFSSRRRSDPYAYVLLTCNKRQTVRILQEIQNLKKELDEGVEELTSDTTVVAIENDSQVVFDALSEAVAPNVVGTIIHYQIVQQRWKRGDRGTVRRVCIVSDAKLFLLNEDYVSDGHISLSNDGNRVGDVSYEVVDEATLPQVAEIRPADADPRSITILINPLSRLSRTHRWRLLCRDSEGAEKLVADVRRAIDMQTDHAL